MSLNLYTYCFNNPIRYWDPTGHYVSEWDRSHLTESEIKQLEYITNNWTAANAAGNTKGTGSTAYWHDQAEKIRGKYRENNEKGTGDGHTVSTANPSPSQTTTYSAPLDGQNSKKDSNNVNNKTTNKATNQSNTRITSNSQENQSSVIIVSTTAVSPSIAPTLPGVAGKALTGIVRFVSKAIPVVIVADIWFSNPIVCDDGFEESRPNSNITAGVSTPASPDPDKEPKRNWEKIKEKHLEKLLKKQDTDPHSVKQEYLGKKAKISRYDIKVDKNTGQLGIFEKVTGKLVEITSYFIKQ